MVGLESITLFRNLDPAELQALRFITQERRFAAGAGDFPRRRPGRRPLFRQGRAVEISSMVGGGARHVFSQLGPGEIFGEMAVIEHRPRSATATALKDTEVHFIPRGEMLSLLERSPALAFRLLQQISHRLREFNQLHLREIVQAERLAIIGNFARSIVHDLKNPLTIIGLSAETFDTPNIRPELRAKAQCAHPQTSQRISDMIGDILIFTKAAQKDVELQTGRLSRIHP